MNTPIKDRDWVKKKVCGEKLRYETKSLAELALTLRQQGGTICKTMCAYNCRYCNQYHLGHNKLREARD